MTTLQAFYYGLSRLSVTGVARTYEYEPDGVTTADLPALWVALPSADNGAASNWATACDVTGKSRTAVVVVAIEPAGQDGPGRNTAAVLRMMDALEMALDGLTYPYVDYTLTGGQPIETALTQYWGVTATVTIRG